ncbi:MAG: hypothetical protein C0622_09180 [Desulfuromonas sp.]|nr:MAG: hypothetical protein C0622_09180 [Desulfuromonas sp.]
MKIHLSSETYALAPADLINLPAAPAEELQLLNCRDEIIIRIGNSKRDEVDALLKGRKAVEDALTEGIDYIPVRIAFHSGVPERLAFLSAFKSFRKKNKYKGTGVYHMSAREVRLMNIERAIRSRNNAYGFRDPKRRPEEDERLLKYQRLVDSLTLNGYDDNEPIRIMVCRSFGLLDSLNQGHHRVSAALEAGIDRIAVTFWAVAKPPIWMTWLLILPAKLKKLQLKHQRSKF